MSFPKVSFILPFYNAELYIQDAMESIINQDYDKLEFIFINDSSSDNSVGKVIEVINKYPCIQFLFVTSLQKGLVNCLNLGISMARGTWIARMDADDISYKNRISSQVEYAEKNKLDICGSGVLFFKNSKSFKFLYPEINSAIVKSHSILGINSVAHPSVIFRRELNLNYSCDYKYVEDFELWCRSTINNLKIGNINLVLLKYRVHDTQVSSSKRLEQIDLTKKISINLHEHLKKKKYFDFHHKISTSDLLILKSLSMWEVGSFNNNVLFKILAILLNNISRFLKYIR